MTIMNESERSSDNETESDHESYGQDPNQSESESSEYDSKDNSQSNTMTESSSDDEPIRRKKSSKSEKKEIMKVIKNNPEDFGLRRSSRAVSTLSEGSNSDDDSADDEYITSSNRIPERRSERSMMKVKEVDYGISSESSDDEPIAKKVVEDTGDKIEKVLDVRDGPMGFVGNQTIVYNEAIMPELKKDDQTEKQYLIKWQSWSNLHNTWESVQSIKSLNCAGVRKLENFIKREEEAEYWMREAQPEEQEYYMIQKEMEREVYQQHVLAERIIAKRTVKLDDGSERLEYIIKWKGLPYSEATWEEESLCKNRFTQKITEFEFRQDNQNFPSANNSYQKRPKFKKQESFGCIPEGICLRDYQLGGVNWLMHAWGKGNSCILADEMGLGKTIQTVTFMNNLFVNHSRPGPYLCCVPLSTLAAWQHEFQKWAPQMNVIAYIGDQQSRNMIYEHEWGTRKELKFNVILTTYEIALREATLFNTVRWAVLAVDEAHRLKNDEAQLYRVLNDLKTEHRLLITGTPLQNSMRELWCLLDFANPGQMGTWEEFEAKHDDGQNEGFSNLHKELHPYLLRRVKKDVEKSLPNKIEQILRVGLSKKQKKYYKWILTKNFGELTKGKNGSKSSFTNIMVELKKCANHSWLIKPPEDDEIAERLQDADSRIDKILKGSGKMMLLDKLLRRLKDTGHRVLIFSQMVRMLDVIGEYMALRRFKFQRLDGGIRGDLRTRAMEHFNADGSEDFAFLLSTRAGGLGINLATADTVIIFDSDWNPQNDLQAQARAHRIGQKNTVNIYRFVSAGSIEEDVIERAKKKMVLDHLVIQRMDTSGRTVLSKGGKNEVAKSIPFNKDEINQILKFGAEELFKENEDESGEPDCDIDLILSRAETAVDAPTTQSDELLSAFKVADFNLDEDKLWDDIIPSDQRIKQAENESQQLGERKAKVKSLKEISSEDDKDEHDSDNVDDKENKNAPLWRGLTQNQTKHFLKSVKKWGTERKEILRAENSFPHDFNIEEATIELLESLIECEKQSSGKGKGPSLKLGAQPVPVKVTLARIRALTELYNIVDTIDLMVLPTKIRSVNNWTCNWTEKEDKQLLKSVLKYGVGTWEEAKADKDLELNSKILPTSDDATPQAKHLSQRFDYIMKYVGLRNTAGTMSSKSRKRNSTNSRPDSVKKNMPKKRHEKTSKKARITETKIEKLEKSNEKASKPADSKTFNDPDLNYNTLRDPLSEDWFTKCKAEMKPHKYARLALKALHQAGQNKKSIKRIMPDISAAIEKISEFKGDQKSEWKNSLWRFVSQFSECDSIQLVKIYEQNWKKPAKKKDDKIKPKDKEQIKKEKREREEKKERHREKLKRRYENQSNGSCNFGYEQKDKRSYEKDERKRKFHRKYENSFDKYRRLDPPQAPSMF